MIYQYRDDYSEFETITDSKAYKLYKILEKSGNYNKLSTDQKEIYNREFSEARNWESYFYGRIKINGWVIDFSTWMKDYWVKSSNYITVKKVKSFNKRMVRKNSIYPSQIEMVMEVR